MAEAAEGRVARRGRTRRSAGRGWILVGLVAVVAIAAGVLLWMRARTAEPAVQELRDAIAEAGAAPAPAADGSWRPLPAPPLPPRDEQAAVWTGSELVVWGGALDDGFGRRTFHADGAALDPASGAWRQLAAAPLEPRTGHVAVWAGAELVVWGGTGRTGLLADGAVYTPATDRWRPLPEAPLSPRAGAAAVWTGSRVLVVGGADNAGPLLDAAAYDPGTGSWEALGELPPEFADGGEISAVAAGDGAVAWTAGRGGLGFTLAARYDPAAGTWSALPDPLADRAGGLPLLVAAGDRLYGLRVSDDGVDAELVVLDPGSPAWAVAPAPSPSGDPWESTALWTGTAVVIAASDGSGALAYDPQNGSWSAIPQAPTGARAHSIAWTGQELLLIARPPVEGTDGGAAWLPRP